MPQLTNIADINKSYIEQVVTQLLSQKLYRCEAQLQFEIAWQIKEALTLLPECDVCLEYLSAASTYKEKTNRLYTDIIIFNEKTEEFIPIELKFKTKSYFHDGFELLKNHGAQDLGSYDFLWDVKRIEMLKSETNSLISNSNEQFTYSKDKNLANFIRGFCIMVTNDSTYHSSNHSGYAQCFYPKENKEFSRGTPYNWIGRNTSAHFYNSWRDMPLTFVNDYTCNWSIDIPAPKPYSLHFKYLVLEVK